MNKFIRSAVTSEFTQIPNVIITDGRLTGSSLRLLLALYSLPRDWIVTLSGLAGRFGMTRSAVSAGMKKLKELGYVSISIERDGDGTFCYRYVLCDLEDKAEKLEKAASWEIRKSPKGKAKYQPVENSAEADNSIPDLPESVLTVSEKPVSVKIHTTNTVLTNTGHKNTVLTNIDRCPSDSDGDEESTKDFCEEKGTGNEWRPQMGKLAEAKPKTEGGPLAREVYEHEQCDLRNLLQERNCETESSTEHSVLRKHPFHRTRRSGPPSPSGAGVGTPTRARIDYYDLKAKVKSTLDYDVARERFDFTDDVVNLIAEKLAGEEEKINIGGVRYSAEMVKDRLRQIKCSHLEYIDLALSEKRDRIKNPKAYLLSMLFNAPATINTYFDNRVRADQCGA